MVHDNFLSEEDAIEMARVRAQRSLDAAASAWTDYLLLCPPGTARANAGLTYERLREVMRLLQ
ncbi:hypothetical protein [Paraburkholderia sp. BCC1886]|uniref:hypothetical protein n=1 Tax=Paraburkholderia sp. BCC1886 TaxID=2562670 RepID=UPI0011836A4D|nr:hypothetical protein [Paraburkholderia sp. BCC1886]